MSQSMDRLLGKLSLKSLRTRRRSRDSRTGSGTPDESSEHVSKGRERGLFLLYDPSPEASVQPYGVDIVAIHGLNGDARRTWTHSNGTLWLQDLLPQKLPGARVFSYGYPSDIAFSRSAAGIRDYASLLLERLWREKSSEEHQRPIIFVCHSLGGIVFKQAMILAFENDLLRPIFLLSKGVVFMGTPHQGSATARMGKVLGDIVNVATSGTVGIAGRVNTKLLEDLSRDSTVLFGIADSFKHRADAFFIVSFYETAIMPVINHLVVERSSAVMGLKNEHCVPLWANHRDLCRFPSREDQTYQVVVDELKQMAQKIVDGDKLVTASFTTDRSYNAAEKSCASMLNTTDIAGYESTLGRQADGTLQWVLKNPQYKAWANSTGGKVLWVTGYPGCGKTILSLYMKRYLLDNLAPSALLCYFFCDNKVETQRDESFVLRSLIFQIASQRRRLFKYVVRAYNAGGAQIFQQFDALWNLFVQLICNLPSTSVIIDAIDECDGKAHGMISKRIVGLTSSGPPHSVKFFITSRPSAANYFGIASLQSSEVIHLRLEEEQDSISRDVKVVISQRLEELVQRGVCKDSTRKMLVDLLVTKADKTFLWVGLVLSLLEERSVLLSSQISSIAAQIPPNLKSLYDQLLLQIKDDDRPLAAHMLHILIASARPLDGEEVGTLLTITAEHHSISALEGERKEIDNQTVQAALGPLIRVRNSKVYLVHQSLKDYLLNLPNDQGHPLAPDFGVDPRLDALMIGRACMNYLALKDFDVDLSQLEAIGDISASTSARTSVYIADDNSSTFDLYEEPLFKESSTIDASACDLIASRYKFFDYAATNWAAHLAEADDASSKEDHEVAALLSIPGSVRLENWLRYFWFKYCTGEPYPENFGPLLVASYFGQLPTVRYMLREGIDQYANMLEEALYWAARQGQTECLEILLERTEFGVVSLSPNSPSPLNAAARGGHLKCVQALLQDTRVDSNAQDTFGRTSLALAAASGHASIVKVLLLHPLIIVDIPDRQQSTPIFWAVEGSLGGSLQTLTHLMNDHRVDQDHTDKYGRTALSWAAEDGSYDTVKVFVKSVKVNPGKSDHKGRTPLSYAAEHGHPQVVRLLMKTMRANVGEVDKGGRNALSWAAAQKTIDVLQYLLGANEAGADVEDVDGWTPIQWALNPPGYLANVALLLKSGLVNVNRKDRVYGRPPLSWAASYGYTEIARTFIGTFGIESDARDNNGRTPLSHAAGMGNIGVMLLLLEESAVEINSKDNMNRTPLFWAAGEGHREVVTTLLSLGSIETDIIDMNGATASDNARRNGHMECVSILESKRGLDGQNK